MRHVLISELSLKVQCVRIGDYFQNKVNMEYNIYNYVFMHV